MSLGWMGGEVNKERERERRRERERGNIEIADRGCIAM